MFFGILPFGKIKMVVMCFCLEVFVPIREFLLVTKDRNYPSSVFFFVFCYRGVFYFIFCLFGICMLLFGLD